MPTPVTRVNRGPAIAPQNRAAILTAARSLFASRGLHVPLNAIAREAGVGQGVLYRHFPSRLDLAFAVFEDNLRDLATVAALDRPDAFLRLWQLLLEQTVREAAFVELVVERGRTEADYDGGARLHEMIESSLPRARAAGLVGSEVDADAVELAWRMAFGIVATAADAQQAYGDLRQVRLLGLAVEGPALRQDTGTRPPE